MLTLFTVPKPFVGAIGEIQLLALRSWAALAHDIQVVLLGEEPGTAEAARRTGVEHVSGLVRNGNGTPRLDSAFALADSVARHRLRCLVNADIVLLDDFLPVVRRVAVSRDQFLMVGRTVDLPGVTELEVADPERLRKRAGEEGTKRGPAAIDYFVFPVGLFGELPAFLLGRACFDNWLLWKARTEGDVVDASEAVLAIHQSHDYRHLEGGKHEAYQGAEAAHNLALAGGRGRMYTLHDASHRIRADGTIRRNWDAPLRWRETARRARAKAALVARGATRPTG